MVKGGAAWITHQLQWTIYIYIYISAICSKHQTIVRCRYDLIVYLLQFNWLPSLFLMYFEFQFSNIISCMIEDIFTNESHPPIRCKTIILFVALSPWLIAGGEVSFIDFQKGDETAHVRFNVENSAQTIFDKMEGGKVSNSHQIHLSIQRSDALIIIFSFFFYMFSSKLTKPNAVAVCWQMKPKLNTWPRPSNKFANDERDTITTNTVSVTAENGTKLFVV